MKYITQFLWILAFSFAGEVLHVLLPLPIPAGIYGLILLFSALALHIVPLSSVKDTGSFLIQIMPLMFIPAAVGLLNSWGSFSSILLPAILIILCSTILVIAVCGRVTQSVLKHRKKED